MVELFVGTLLILIFILLLVIFKQNSIIYLFICLYPILPEYFAINLGDSLPLLTGSRMLVILLALSTILTKTKITFSSLTQTNFLKIFIFYIICETIVFITHVDNMESVKDYFGIILEKVLFLIIILNNVDNVKKLEKCIQILVITGGVVFAVASTEPFTGVNLSYFLDTGVRDTLLMANYERLNVTRATFSFGHPIALAVYTIAIMPFIMYLIDITQKKSRYVFIFILSFVCLLLTISRGQILIFMVMFIFIMKTKKKNERIIYYKMLLIGSGIVIFSFLLNAEILGTFKGIIFSVLNSIGFNFNISDFGSNEDGTSSRFDQWSILPQVLAEHPFCGGGSGYIFNNDIYIKTSTRTYLAESIDNMYLSLLINKGIIGFLGTVIIYLKIAISSFTGGFKNNNNPLSKAFFFSFICIFLSYMTVTELTTNRIFWTIIGLYIVHLNILKKNSFKSLG